jgi:RHS repeat-associated protein
VQETSGAAILANILPGLGIDEFFTRADVAAGITSNFLTDALGSTVAVTDNAGAVQTEYTYEAFGKTIATGASNNNSYQFTSRENDGTDLYYYRARYYSPTLTRFMSEDPLGIVPRGPGKLNHLFSYVDNRPTILRDPSGLLTECEDRLLTQRMAAFALCLARAFYNNRSQLNLCVGICYQAIMVGGLNPLLNAGCVACIGVGSAVLWDKVSSCIDEANQIPDTCGKCK